MPYLNSKLPVSTLRYQPLKCSLNEGLRNFRTRTSSKSANITIGLSRPSSMNVEKNLTPNSRLVRDACESALRASFGAPQPGRYPQEIWERQ